MKYYTDKDGINHFGNAKPSRTSIEMDIPTNIIPFLEKGIDLGSLSNIVAKSAPKQLIPLSYASTQINLWFRRMLIRWDDAKIKLVNW